VSSVGLPARRGTWVVTSRVRRGEQQHANRLRAAVGRNQAAVNGVFAEITAPFQNQSNVVFSGTIRRVFHLSCGQHGAMNFLVLAVTVRPCRPPIRFQLGVLMRQRCCWSYSTVGAALIWRRRRERGLPRGFEVYTKERSREFSFKSGETIIRTSDSRLRRYQVDLIRSADSGACDGGGGAIAVKRDRGVQAPARTRLRTLTELDKCCSTSFRLGSLIECSLRYEPSSTSARGGRSRSACLSFTSIST